MIQTLVLLDAMLKCYSDWLYVTEWAFLVLYFLGLKSKVNVSLGSFVEEKMECNIILFYNEHRRIKRREKKNFRWALLWHK